MICRDSRSFLEAHKQPAPVRVWALTLAILVVLSVTFITIALIY